MTLSKQSINLFYRSTNYIYSTFISKAVIALSNVSWLISADYMRLIVTSTEYGMKATQFTFSSKPRGVCDVNIIGGRRGLE